MSVSFPNIKAIMWFDELKVEAQAGGAVIDWRFTGNQQIQSGLGIYLQIPAKSTGAKYWLQLSDYLASTAQITCSGSTAASTTATTTATSTATAQTSSPAAAAKAAPVPPTIQSSTHATIPAATSTPASTPITTSAATTQTIQSTATMASMTPVTTPNAVAQGSTQSQVASLAMLIGRRLLARGGI